MKELEPSFAMLLMLVTVHVRVWNILVAVGKI